MHDIGIGLACFIAGLVVMAIYKNLSPAMRQTVKDDASAAASGVGQKIKDKL